MRLFLSVLILLVLACGVSCAGSSGQSAARAASPERAYVVLDDASQNVKKRVAAVRSIQVAVDAGTTPRATARAALKRIAWSWHQGTPSAVRIAAIDALLEHEAQLNDTRTMLTLMTPTEQQREVLEHVCAIAGERQWRRMTPAMIRSWSRKVRGWDDLERPEAAALAALWPEQPVNEVLFAVFASTDEVDAKARSAAWTMLTRLDPEGEQTRALVEAGSAALDRADDPLSAAIAWAWRELHVAPKTSEQLAWVQRLHESDDGAALQALIDAAGALPVERRAGLEMRHLPLLAWVRSAHPTWLDLSRGELESRVLEGLEGSRAFGPGARRPGSDLGEAPWHDLLTALAALQATRDPAVRAQLFEQAEVDRLDESTEHGGVLEVNGKGVWQAIAYPPRPTERFSDQQFVASDDMIRRGDLGVFHYHFHAQRHNNRRYATPSGGDFDTARRLGRSSLVLTFVDANRMNIDLYLPDGMATDLGTIERPQ